MELKSILQSKLPETAVSSNTDDLALFKVSNPVLKEGAAPAYIVRPKDFSELQDLVKVANEQKLGLVPVSSSGPHCKGGIICNQEHIIVDLSAWKKILWVNRRNLVCIVEPGVTYAELLSALDAQGMTVPTPLAPRSGKSTLAAMMDREPSIWPVKQWDIQDPVASTEFIFGTGDQFRTGAACAAGTLEQQRESAGAQKGPLGPSATGFQRIVQGSQGSMGIATWVSVRAEIKPSLEKTYLLGANDHEKLIPYVYEVQRAFLGEHSFILNRTAAAMLMTYGDTGSFDEVRKSLPEFICLQNIAGFERLPKERLKYQEDDIKKIAARNGLSLEPTIGLVSAQGMLKTAASPCGCGEKDWRYAPRGHCLSVIIMTTLNRTPEFIKVFTESAKGNQIDNEQIGIYIQPTVQNHSCHVEFMVPFNPEDAGEVEKMRRLEEESVRALNKAHAFFSRPYGTAAKIVFNNNPKNTELLKTVKGILDPNKVLNPGKFGL